MKEKSATEGIKSYAKPLKVLVSGSSGLIGSALVQTLAEAGFTVKKLVRSQDATSHKAYFWDPNSGILESLILEGLDAVIHLGGEPIAKGRWTRKKRELIRSSRVKSTRCLSETLARCKHPPRIFLCASAIGYYGNCQDTLVTEKSPPGTGFLAEVCKEWEAACSPALEKGVRVVNLRFGMVLSPTAGALRAMLLPFRLGLGGRLGQGDQYMSWIALDDATRAIVHALLESSIRGPLNLVSPNPVTNSEFTRTLSRVLSRPAPFRIPAALLRLALGRAADELLLASCRVKPAKLEQTGFGFIYPRLESALKAMLK